MLYSLLSLGERAIVIRFGKKISEETHRLVVNIVRYLEQEKIAGVIEYVPAYCSITLHYHPLEVIEGVKRTTAQWQSLKSIHHSPSQLLQYILKEKLSHFEEQNMLDAHTEHRIVEIPVCYGEEFGPDLLEVASYHQLSPDQVVALHSKATYLVHMLGFAPGFPYMGGMDPAIATPRKAIPRAFIVEGSVGIAGEQTGIYPVATPGGWQIIGRTPIKLFDPRQEIPSIVQAGDKIKFIPISKAQFNDIKAMQWT